jgi:CheY-like chemotaxis protein
MEPTATPPSRQATLLLIDDEDRVRAALAAGLARTGFVVHTAANAGEAIEVYRRHGPDIDLVLLDVRMPGVDGPQTLAALQTINPAIRCCFMSGDIGHYTEEELLACGGERVLRKPFHLTELAQDLRQLIDEGPLPLGGSTPAES